MKVKKAVIPAAGLGTRMLPATKSIPKEMLPLVDRPLIHYIVEEAVQSGIEDILIITNRGKGPLDDYFDHQPELEDRLKASGKEREYEAMRAISEMANIFYVRQKETRGLGHAVGCARHFVGGDHFAVLLGDDIMRSHVPVTKQLIEVAERYGTGSVGVQAVAESEISKYCTLKVQQVEPRVYDVSQLIEKPKPNEVFSLFAILGRYVLPPAIFDIIDKLPPGHGGEIQLTDALNVLCQQERLLAVDFEGRRHDAGNLKGYLEATLDFAKDHPEAGPWLKEHIKQLAKTF